MSEDIYQLDKKIGYFVRKLKELGNVLETTPSEAALKSGKFSGRLSVKITTDTAQGNLEVVIRDMGEVSSLKIEPLGEESIPPLSKEEQRGDREKEGGEPKGETAKFIKFILSPAGQKIVAQEGFVPLADSAKTSVKGKK